MTQYDHDLMFLIERHTCCYGWVKSNQWATILDIPTNLDVSLPPLAQPWDTDGQRRRCPMTRLLTKCMVLYMRLAFEAFCTCNASMEPGSSLRRTPLGRSTLTTLILSLFHLPVSSDLCRSFLLFFSSSPYACNATSFCMCVVLSITI
jgi:hypothetical protein